MNLLKRLFPGGPPPACSGSSCTTPTPCGTSGNEPGGGGGNPGQGGNCGARCNGNAGNCFAEGTVVHTSRGTQAIETIRIGQRVITYLPHERTEPEPEEPTAMEWAAHRVITLLLPCEDEQWIRMQLLRDPDWFRMMAPEVGETIFLDMPEMGVEGDATVEAIEPCPEIEIGEGRVVTATFHHSSGECLELDIEGEDSPLRVTAGHPIWRFDRNDAEGETLDWTSCCSDSSLCGRDIAGTATDMSDLASKIFESLPELREFESQLVSILESATATMEFPVPLFDLHPNWTPAARLDPGDTVSTVDGTARIRTIRLDQTARPAFNIEVQGDHVYRVASSAVLVHNASPVTPGADYGCENPAGSGNITSCSGTQLASKLGGCVPNSQAHHLIPCAEKNTPALNRAADLGFNINGEINGWCLPTNASDPRVTGQEKLPVHCNWDACHSQYNRCAQSLLEKLEQDRRTGVVNDCNLCDAVSRVIRALRTALENHVIWLNNNDPNKRTWRCPTKY